MSETFELVAWAYNFLVLVLITILDFLPFLKNLDSSKTSLCRCIDIGERSLTISTAFLFDLSEYKLLLNFNNLGFNLFETTFLKEASCLLIGIESYSAS